MNPNSLLIEEHISYFNSIVFRFIPRRYFYLGEDMAQDAIIRCIDKIHLYDQSKGNLKAWIYRVTQHYCFDMIKKLDRMQTTPITFDLMLEENHPVINNIEKKKIRKALSCLKKRDREMIMLKFYFNYSGKEIGKALEIPEKQVATCFKRAKEKLKEKYHQVA
tara:strand:+ start:1537 stop:2025 length:489 start_codon:yes stop_codon:yes gene_type:complete